MFGLISIDLDGLKFINENYGYRAGFTMFNESNNNIDELIDEADKKMYEIKRSKLNLKL